MLKILITIIAHFEIPKSYLRKRHLKKFNDHSKICFLIDSVLLVKKSLRISNLKARKGEKKKKVIQKSIIEVFYISIT